MATATAKKSRRKTPHTSGPVHLLNLWKLACGKTRTAGMASSNKLEKVTCEECRAKVAVTQAVVAASKLNADASASPATAGPATNGPASTRADGSASFLPSTMVLRAKLDYMNTVLDDIYAKLVRVASPEAEYVKGLIMQTKS